MTLAVAESQTSSPPRCDRLASRAGRWVIPVAVAVLLGLYATVTFLVAERKGVSFDEGEEMAVGYDQWRRHDFRMENANGDFIKRWATLPFLWSQPKLPSTDKWFWKQGGAYELGYAFCFNVGNNPDHLLQQARAMNILLGVATGLLVFAISRTLFGAAGGLVSLALFVLSAHMLAFGAIVSTEMSTCFALLGAIWFAWRLLHRVTLGRLAASLIFTSLLVLAKLTSLTAVPIAAALIAVKLAGPRPLVWGIGRVRLINAKWRQGGIFAALLAVHVGAGWLAIWTHYEFRYAASPQPGDPTIIINHLKHPDPVSPVAAGFIHWSRRTHFLPEGFLNGVERLLEHNDNRITFLDGQWKIGGLPHFFPRTIWLKSSPGFLLLLVLAALAWWYALRVSRSASAAPVVVDRVPRLYEVTPLLAIIVVVVAFAVAQNLNIGHRHVLPIYPPLFILAGATGLTSRFFRKAAYLVLVLLGGIGVDSAANFPNYLSYFNPLMGGSKQGYQHLVDSSVDWGMDLPELKRWLDRNNPGNREAVFLAYFGTDSPSNRHIECHQLPGFFDWRPPKPIHPLTAGLYAISVTLAQSVYTDPLGPWSTLAEKRYQFLYRELQRYEEARGRAADSAVFQRHFPPEVWARQYQLFEKLRFGRLCAWLRHHGKPIENVGNSILIWRLEAADLRAALFGPPAELDDTFLYDALAPK